MRRRKIEGPAARRRSFSVTAPLLLIMSALGPLLLWAIPILLFVALVPIGPAIETNGLVSSLPRIVTVGSTKQTLKTSVQGAIGLGVPPMTRSPVSGTVTASSLVAGSVVANGAPVAEVNGTNVLAYVGDQPFFRDLNVGSTGRDVQRLNDFLANLGSPTQRASDKFTAATKSAVMSLEQGLGLPRDGVFRTTYVAFVPRDLKVVRTVTLVVGDTIAAGDPMFLGESPVVSVNLIPSNDSQSLSALQASALVLEIGKNRINIESTNLAPAELVAVADALAGTTLLGATTPTAATTVTVPGLFVELRDPRKSGIVPSSAIFTSRNGNSCVFYELSPDKFSARDVTNEVGQSDAVGEALVPVGLMGAQVVRNPSTLAQGVTKKCA